MSYHRRNAASAHSAVPGIRIAARVGVCGFRLGRVHRLPRTSDLFGTGNWTTDLVVWNRVRRRCGRNWIGFRRHTRLIAGHPAAASFCSPTAGPLGSSGAGFSAMSVVVAIGATRYRRQRFVRARAVDRTLFDVLRSQVGADGRAGTGWWWRPAGLRATQGSRFRHRPDPASLIGVRRTASTTGKHVRHVAGKWSSRNGHRRRAPTAQVGEVVAVIAVVNALLRLSAVEKHVLRMMTITRCNVVVQTWRPVVAETRRRNVPDRSLKT